MYGLKMGVALGLCLVASHAFSADVASDGSSANDESVKEILSRVEGKVDQIAEVTTEQKRRSLDQPLGDRKHGVEFNYFRLLTLGEDSTSLSGTYSRFNTNDNVEIAFPIMHSNGEVSDYFGDDNDGSVTSLTVDMHYRKYLGETLNGFYLSGFTRAAYLNGKLRSDGYSSDSNSGSEFKLGVGVGLGYRIISKSNWYWGASFSLGRYVVGDSDKFADTESVSVDLDDQEYIIDVEFMKFGYAF